MIKPVFLSKQLRILVTAGPTREYLDPVRFISNESTGTMGLACVQEAHHRGHQVKLIWGTDKGWRVKLGLPKTLSVIPVVTGREMLRALRQQWADTDVLIMVAAICDFRPARILTNKIKRDEKKSWTLRLVRNPDVLKVLSSEKKNRCLVGFALETRKGTEWGEDKLKQKGLDIVVCNWVVRGHSPFGDRKTTVAILDREGGKRWLKNVSKTKVAQALVDKVEQICYQRRGKGG